MSSYSSYEKDKERFDGWREYLLKEQEEEQTQKKGLRAKLAGAASAITGKINAWWKASDEYLKKDFCDAKLPQHLKAGGDVVTFGDLQAVLKCSTGYENRVAFLKMVTGILPGLKHVTNIVKGSEKIQDFALSMYQVPDGQRPPKGNIGKMDMDDPVSEIIDNNLEKEFLDYYIKKISDDGMMDTPIGKDWNITKEITAWLQKTKEGRTITGYEGK
jgi:hypothetical protein